MNFQVIGRNIIQIAVKYWDKFLIDGLSYTFALSAITVAFGAIFGAVLALQKMSKIAPLRWLSVAYVEIIRGTPMLVQALIIHFGVPQIVNMILKAAADGGAYTKFTFTAFASSWAWAEAMAMSR